MKPYVFTEEAKADLSEIWSYIAGDNEPAADKLEAEIYEACERLARRPDIGHSRQDLTSKAGFVFPREDALFDYLRSCFKAG
jgi:plasmid stabilization system protein ParE